jgi:hypothetical protein
MSEVSAQLLHGFPGFLGEHEAGHEYASRSGAQPQKDGSRGGHQHQGRSCCAPVCFSRADRSCPLVVQGCYVVAGLGPAFLSDPSFESASNQNGAPNDTAKAVMAQPSARNRLSHQCSLVVADQAKHRAGWLSGAHPWD